MKKCPVCGLELSDPVPSFCPRQGCGWELRNDLTLIPSLDMPDSAIRMYSQRIGIARKNWNERAETMAKLEELEKRLKKIEILITQQNESQRSEQPDMSQEKIAMQQHEWHYVEKIPVADLKRDPFETLDEFETKINRYPRIQAGIARLLKEKYDIETGAFPLHISWDEWIGAMEQGPFSGDDFYIVANRDVAKATYEAGTEHSVFVTLKAKGKKAVIDTIELAAGEARFSISSRKMGREEPESVSHMELVCVPGRDCAGDEREIRMHEVRLEGFSIEEQKVAGPPSLRDGALIIRIKTRS